MGYGRHVIFACLCFQLEKMSISNSFELNAARKHLADALGDRMNDYLQLLKSWFKRKISREDFDHEARNLLTSETVHLHNRFLLAILTKCQSLGSSLLTGDGGVLVSRGVQPTNVSQMKKLKNKKSSMVCTSGLYQRFLPVDPLCQAPQIMSQCPDQDDKVLEYASRDLLLPDIALINGRVMVTAWEFGLDNVEDDVIHLLMTAIEMQLKTLLAATVSRQAAYRLRENHFRHSYGTQLPPVQLKRYLFDCDEEMLPTALSSQGLQVPAMRPSFEVAQRNCAMRLACAGPTAPVRHVVTLYDLLEALQVHKSCLPSHTVYTLNIQRILYRLWHPSHEEIAADEEFTHKRSHSSDQQTIMVQTS